MNLANPEFKIYRLWALNAAAEVREFCNLHQVNLDSRLPIRRQSPENSELRIPLKT